MMRAIAMFLALAAVCGAVPAEAKRLDDTPRTVVMTAFSPEWDALAPAISKPREYKVNGLTFLTGKLEGKPVVLMASGVSMVNAAMNTQLVLDRFNVRRIVFSGIAGGVDPELSIGDVVVAQDWAQYLEVSFARQTEQGWVVPEEVDAGAPKNWNMMFPRGVRLGNAAEPMQRHYTIAVDPGLVDLARKVTSEVTLRRCAKDGPPEQAGPCLPQTPRIVVGGTGVSAGVFADNAEFRGYLQQAWHARVLDMESAAVAQVAYANRVPAIVFRSLSDLAGGDAGANQMNAFMALASVNSAHVVRAFVAALPD
ncbi:MULTISPECIES: 5'-methylthioadenosine/S-adenosylhomocysteine nucleosidase [unclassified Novosphingobium]|uniref:5'-methylthioadenosine/S-adenosylhomocysteine nucleosidase n=2 Tax=Sphingomonadaceae TaxID=41297 RepID=UPI0010523049|nr:MULTISPECIES: 5'-methylthioadenosine/S-adenosylhomocysteine nucleosidase [unclassified Novosphingobium]WRT94600.1 5'-methylthioadenosine/S-adenosylhomocysteine nucleosidase [Novosphingobium sp. RL4]